MADPSTYRPAVGSIPESPGVYRFRDPNGRVVYVGKAKSLRQRLNSYFADVAGLHPRTRQMVTTASSVDWTVVGTEVEALQLEYNWIKEFDPRFNIRYRDDKSYPSLAVTLNNTYPPLHPPLPRRQELPVAGRDAERGVPAAAGHARAEAEGRPLLRALRARLGDPRDPRHAHPRLPGPHLLQRRLQAGEPDRPPLPARLHRQVLGTLRRPGERRGAPRDRRRLLRLHGRQDRPDGQAPRAGDGRGRRGDGVREGRPAARRPRGPEAGDGEAGRG